MVSKITVVRKIRKIWPVPILPAFSALLVFWVLSVYLLEMGFIPLDFYAILGAPFLEEAVKGGLAFIITPLLFLLLPLFSGTRRELIVCALVSGALVGLMFALVESIGQGECIVGIFVGIITHPLLTAAVSVGFCSFWMSGNKLVPSEIYLYAVFGHMAWNFQVLYPSFLASFVAIVILMTAVPIAVLFQDTGGNGIPPI